MKRIRKANFSVKVIPRYFGKCVTYHGSTVMFFGNRNTSHGLTLKLLPDRQHSQQQNPPHLSQQLLFSLHFQIHFYPHLGLGPKLGNSCRPNFCRVLLTSYRWVSNITITRENNGVTKDRLRNYFWGWRSPIRENNGVTTDHLKWFWGVTKSHLRKRSGDEIPIEKMWKSLPERNLLVTTKPKVTISDRQLPGTASSKKQKKICSESSLKMKKDESSEMQSRFYHCIWAIHAYRFPACW